MKAVGFDLGETLIYYENVPMNWNSLYRNALTDMASVCGWQANENIIETGEKILSQYNTRVKPRSEEITSERIIGEILTAWNLNKNIYLRDAEKAFFSYFRKKVNIYEDTLFLLKHLKERSFKVGILTDVPYGMSHEFVDLDVGPISEYIDIVLSSVDVGFRKPHSKGYLDLAKQLNSSPEEMIFVGNEEKDIVGAKAAGMFSVLIEREKNSGCFGEDKRIGTLNELIDII